MFNENQGEEIVHFQGKLKIKPTYVSSRAEIKYIVQEMKDFARSTEFVYEDAVREVVEEAEQISEKILKEKNQEYKAVYAKADNDIEYARKWTKVLQLGPTKEDILQVTYYECEGPNNKWFGQTQIASPFRCKLNEKAYVIMHSFRFPNAKISTPPGLLPYVIAEFQELDRKY